MTLPPLDWIQTDDAEIRTHFFITLLGDPPISAKTTEQFWDVKTMTGVFPISKYMHDKGPVRSYNSLHRHQEVLAEDAEALDEHWTERHHIDDEYVAHRYELLALLGPFVEMWDGHLGTVIITQHRIELTSEAKPSTQIVY